MIRLFIACGPSDLPTPAPIDARGAVLGAAAAGERAAVLRYVDRSGSGAAALGSVAPDGTPRWTTLVHDDPEPPASLPDVAGDPWIVEVGGAGRRSLTAVSAGDGAIPWRHPLANGARWGASATLVVTWDAAAVAVLDRATGAPRDSQGVAIDGPRPQIVSAGDRTVVVDHSGWTSIDGSTVGMSAPALASGVVVGPAVVVWTDPDHTSWWWDGTRSPLDLGGARVRPGGCAHGDVMVVPVHEPSGVAAVLGLTRDGVRWRAEVGQGSWVPVPAAPECPTHTTLALDRGGEGAALVIVDPSAGRVRVEPLPPGRSWDAPRRVHIGDALWIVEGWTLVDPSTDPARVHTVPGPVPEGAWLRVSPEGVWVGSSERVVRQPLP